MTPVTRRPRRSASEVAALPDGTPITAVIWSGGKRSSRPYWIHVRPLRPSMDLPTSTQTWSRYPLLYRNELTFVGREPFR